METPIKSENVHPREMPLYSEGGGFSEGSDAESHAAELRRLNAEIRSVAASATRLLAVTTDLSEAQSVEEVAAVVAARGVLVSVEGSRLRVLGTRGMSAALGAQLAAITYDSDIPVVHALKKGGMVPPA